MWEPTAQGTVTNWNQVDPSFPDESLTLYGAGHRSGTFDYFTDAINGEEGASRSDYTQTEDDNTTVQGVSGGKGALGYFGLSYYEENQDKLKVVQVDDGDGCVDADDGDGAGRHLHAAVPAAVHLPERQAAGPARRHRVREVLRRELRRDRRGGAVRADDRRAEGGVGGRGRKRWRATDLVDAELRTMY